MYICDNISFDERHLREPVFLSYSTWISFLSSFDLIITAGMKVLFLSMFLR